MKNSNRVQRNPLSFQTIERFSTGKRIRVIYKNLSASTGIVVQGLTHGLRTRRFIKRQRAILMLSCARAQENEYVSGSVCCVRVCVCE